MADERQPYWSYERRPRTDDLVEAPVGEIGIMLDELLGVVVIVRMAERPDMLLTLDMLDQLIGGLQLARSEADRMLSGELRPPAAHA